MATLSDIIAAKDPIRWQRKVPSGDITAVGEVTSMQFNNLTPGKTYKITLKGYAFTSNTTAGRITLEVRDGSTVIDFISHTSPGVIGSDNMETTPSTEKIYTMVGTTLEVYAAADMSANRRWERNIPGGTGSGTDNVEGTYLQVEELSNHVVTTAWT
jgi:hypothetical protein